MLLSIASAALVLAQAAPAEPDKLSLWQACVERNAASLALQSVESSEIVATAAFGSCIEQEAAYWQSVYATLRGPDTAFDETN
ncbi:hypothetical protein GCM10011371_09670 [Novosphingobium marinum]|uniref:Uncharacterized protein n=1 Tax=Novosphingobium marinum TaxID=1514948 RepID=A0A7Z0BUD3_9SPHN|nr:hypothetical protein [Novosphingobium marinum]NYH95073.1 hypothetical protein [Novosphingobium marinum]GGC24054.1 hypothetical protein GCM10011371_09670 [Novosphingobium marinum]